MSSSVEETRGASSSTDDQPRRNDLHELQVHAEDSQRSSKRIRHESGERDQNRPTIDVEGLYALHDIVDKIQWSKYGSAAPEIHELYSRKWQLFSMLAAQRQHKVPEIFCRAEEVQNPMVILDSSEDEEEQDRTQVAPVIVEEPLQTDIPPELSSQQFVGIPLSSDPPPDTNMLTKKEECLSEKSLVCDLLGIKTRKDKKEEALKEKEGDMDVKETDNGVFLGVEDDAYGDDAEDDPSGDDVEGDGLGDIWTQMGVAVEMLMDDPVNQLPNEQLEEDEPDCDHSYILKDDIGYVCRVCGLISKAIQSIIEVQYKKYNSSRTYQCTRGHKEGVDGSPVERLKVSGQVLSPDEQLAPFPRHFEVMKDHQIEGFNFLKRNLLDRENPGGCILAHAPGSGKTFMIISFVLSFLAKYPDGRPLVVLPKGILSTWKKEFQKWQIEDTLLLDFYSLKNNNRTQQLKILQQWKDNNKSILFLGYNAFARIMADSSYGVETVSCQEILINLPSIMILDEGHTPRNDDTDVFNTLAKVKTRRKVVLSGTLYQNHVREVFNILNLVRPKFLELQTSKAYRRTIMSSVQISGVRKQLKGTGDSAFYDLVEYALERDEDHKRKEIVISNLREMTSGVLHYYRGDSLDELPGLDDFTIFLKLAPKQRVEVGKLLEEQKRTFKRISLGCYIYMHPILKQLSGASALPGEKSTLPSDDEIAEVIGKIDIQDGVKVKFFLSMLSFCEAAGEKLIVFSQYLLPLKFLERLTASRKGWSVGKEMFMIYGDSKPVEREFSVDRFNNSPCARVFFGSIKACGEGISLVGASRIIILDVHLNPSVSRQAVGRAFRPGQVKKVFAYRLVAADSPEEKDHLSCFKKELISKMWFESKCTQRMHDFEMKEVDVNEAGDMFLESSHLAGDVKFLYKR